MKGAGKGLSPFDSMNREPSIQKSLILIPSSVLLHIDPVVYFCMEQLLAKLPWSAIIFLCLTQSRFFVID